MWARLIDVITVLAAVIAIHVLVFGPLRMGILSIGDPWRALIVALIFGAIRHHHVHTPAHHIRLWRALSRSWRNDAVQVAWPIAALTRCTVLLVGYLAVVSVGFPPNAPPYRISDNEAINLPLRWDTGWYLGIAIDGYQWRPEVQGQQNIAFFPGYPLTTRAVAMALGAQSVVRQWRDLPPRLAMQRMQQTYLASALLVTLLSFAWALVWLYRLAREHLDEPEARAALLLLSTYPFAMFFSAAYTESLMLLAVAGAFYHFKQERWVAAAGWGLLAGLTRPNGFLLAGPLCILALQHLASRRTATTHWDQLRTRALALTAVAAMPAIGAVLYSTFIYLLTGNPFEWREAHTAWGRSFTGAPTLLLPFESITERGVVEYTSAQPVETMNAVGSLLACALVWPVTRRLGIAYGLFMVLNLAPPLLFGGFLSMGRVTSLLFPMFMYLALVLADWQRQALIATFACLQGLAAVLFFTWRVFL